jgi:hypothetical protein
VAPPGVISQRSERHQAQHVCTGFPQAAPSREPPAAEREAVKPHASGSQGHRSIPSLYTDYASRISTSHSSSRANPARSRGTLQAAQPLGLGQSLIAISGLGRAPHVLLRLAVKLGACSEVPRRTGTHCHSSDYWARKHPPTRSESWCPRPVGLRHPEPVTGKSKAGDRLASAALLCFLAGCKEKGASHSRDAPRGLAQRQGRWFDAFCTALCQ